MVAAAAGGNPAIVQLLLDLGVSFGQHWEQALAEATNRGHSEMVSLLISNAPPDRGGGAATAVGGSGQGDMADPPDCNHLAGTAEQYGQQ
jgi:hypothetical protein